jgi:glycosyltransferase involved in cell wall biosynthesis
MMRYANKIKNILKPLEKSFFEKETAQIDALERATIVHAQGTSSEAQICSKADGVKNRFLKLFRYISVWILAAFILMMHGPLFSELPSYPMVIVIPSYNNAKWYEKNLHTVLHQHYPHFRILYVNDCSTDGTGERVEQYLKESRIDYRVIDFDPISSDVAAIIDNLREEIDREKHFFTLINNKKRAGALANLYRLIHSCRDEEIVATVDGDDWLSSFEVLNTLNQTYNSGTVWFTHGTIKEYPYGHVAWSEPIPDHVIKKNAARDFKCPSHLRTFYAWLFKKIPLEDFLYKGEFITMAWDMAIMYPLAEMAAERHAFIKQVLYIYNMSNPINDNRVNAQLQNDLDAWIRKKPRFKRLADDERPK